MLSNQVPHVCTIQPDGHYGNMSLKTVTYAATFQVNGIITDFVNVKWKGLMLHNIANELMNLTESGLLPLN